MHFIFFVLIFTVIASPTFAIEKGLIGAKSSPDISALMAKPVSLGANDAHTNGLILTHDDNTKREVKTCEDYMTAIGDEFYALTTYDMTMESFFTAECKPLIFLASAINSKNTRFYSPYFDDQSPDHLPADLGAIFQMTDEPFCPDADTLASCLSQNLEGFSKNAVTAKDTSLSISTPSEIAGWEILAKGDINHDGWEDIMLSTHHIVTEGSYRAYGTQCMEWTAEQTMPRVISCSP